MPQNRTTIAVFCHHCQTPLLRPPYVLARYPRSFCNHACYVANLIEVQAATAKVRFWSRVDMTGDCWVWLGPPSTSGYGRFCQTARQREYAHRVSWKWAYGPTPDGLFVCHHCDQPLCVRPEHLFLGTHQENMKDMVRKGRQSLGEKHACQTRAGLPLGDAYWTPARLSRPWPVGSKNSSAKLVESDIIRIRTLGKIRGQPRLLAIEYKMSKSRIGGIVRGEGWQHVKQDEPA